MIQKFYNYSISGRTITFTGLNVPQDRILLVTDVTNGGILYSLATGNGTWTQGTNSTLAIAGSGTIGPVLSITYDDGIAETNSLTDAQLRASAVPVSGTVTANTGLTQPLTDAQLRASAVPVSAASLPLPSGAAVSTLQLATNSFLQLIDEKVATETTVAALNAKVPSQVSGRIPVDGSGVTQPVSGTVTANTGLSQPLTDAQLRATAVPVSGTVTANTGLTQPLTDTQLRATAVPVSGTVTANTGLTQPLTDTELRASAVPISASSLPLPTGAATSAGISDGTQKTQIVDADGTSQDVMDLEGVKCGITAIGGVYAEISTANSSTSNLGSAATFTGTVESCFGHQAASILVRSDQNGTLTVNGWQDAGGTVLVQRREYRVTANVPFNIAALLNSNYFNLTFTNNGSSSTTNLIIDTAFGWLQPQTALGNIPVSMQEFALVGAAASIAPINTDLITGVVSGWFDASAYKSASIQIIASSGISAGQIIFECTNDTSAAASGNAWAIEEDTSLTPTPQTGAFTISASTTRMFRGPVTARFVRVRASTGFVGGTVKAAAFFSQMPYNRMVQTVHQATGTNLNQNMSHIGGQAVIVHQPNGSSNRATTVAVAGPLSNTDYSAQAWAAASGNGATISSSAGLGCAAAFDVNLTAWTVGSSTGLDIYLQESPDNGTTWYDIWQCEALTGIARRRIPAIPIGGRRRMRWVNRTGAATTATVTVTAMDLSMPQVKQVQWFDRTAGVGSGNAVTGTNSAAYDIAGCNSISVVMQAGTATAVGSFKAQMSIDGTNWFDASTETPIASTSANNTRIPIIDGCVGRFLRVTCTAQGTTQVISAIHIYGCN